MLAGVYPQGGNARIDAVVQPPSTEPRSDASERAIARGAPAVSVLIPVWNAERSIGRALASVLEEQPASIEVIVVDDGSTDGTVEVVRGVARRDPRVVLLPLGSNEGVSAARNRGLDLVRGEWLTLLDADDRFLPGGFGRLVGTALGSDALAVVGQQVWSDGERTWTHALYDIPDIRRPGRTSLAARPGLLYFVSPHAKVFHRSCYEGLRFSGRVLGDQPWIIRALLRAGDRIEVVGDTVYEWSRPASGPGSITSRTRSSARRGVEAAAVAIEALASVRDEARHGLDEEAQEAVLTRYVERLLRSDLAMHLRGALRRGDPTIHELIQAIEAFVTSTPARLIAGSDALARDILEPPLGRWFRVDRAGRDAYWRLFATALRMDPAVTSRMRGWPARLMLGIVRRWPNGTGRKIADVLLIPAGVATLAMALARRLRPR